MTGTIIVFCRKQASYWTIQWEINAMMTKIQNNGFWSHEMKCDNMMAECLIDAQKRFDSLHPESKHTQNLKRCMTQFSHHETHKSSIKQILTPTQKSIKCSKKHLLTASILPQKCVERVLSNLLMSPPTSPDDHSPLKPALSIEIKEMDNDTDSYIDDIEGLNSETIILFWNIYKDCIINHLCKPEFMEMDGTSDHNIEIPLTSTYGTEPESIWNFNKYNRKGPAVTTNAFNHFKDLLECSCW